MRQAQLVVLGCLAGIAAAPAFAAEYSLVPAQAAVGAMQSRVTGANDTLLDIAREYDVGYVQLIAANPGIDPWFPGVGTKVTIPSYYILPDAPRTGIVVNLAERRIFYFTPEGGRVVTFPAGIAVEDGATPLGLTRVVSKEAAPVWIPPPSIRAERPELPLVVGPGPDNPLGDFALRLGWTNYLVHGTNKPVSVGRNVSHVCLHLYPEDIAALFASTAVGTPVRVIEEAAEVAWIGDRLFVEAHPSKAQADDIDMGKPFSPDMPQKLISRVAMLAGDRQGLVDWEAVRRAGIERRGIPIPVTNFPALRVSDTAN
jgi:L,D-transpeptidase ErfK/SrfK